MRGYGKKGNKKFCLGYGKFKMQMSVRRYQIEYISLELWPELEGDINVGAVLTQIIFKDLEIDEWMDKRRALDFAQRFLLSILSRNMCYFHSYLAYT